MPCRHPHDRSSGTVPAGTNPLSAVQSPDNQQHQTGDAEYEECQENEAGKLAEKHEERVQSRIYPPESIVEE